MTASAMRTVTLPDGTVAPALGLGTWYLVRTPAASTSSWTPCVPGSTWA